MRKFALIIAVILAFTFSAFAFAQDINISGTFTTEAEYDFTGVMDLVDTTELTLSTAINDTTTAELVLTVEELIFGTVGIDVSGNLCFDLGEDETAEIGVDIDLLTGDLEFGGEYLGLAIADDILINAKAKYKYPASTYYGVVTLLYDFNEDMDLVVEARADSDGAESVSLEAQLTYNVGENIDLMIGIELNDWSDDINDWDDYEILDSSDKAYAKIEFSF